MLHEFLEPRALLAGDLLPADGFALADAIGEGEGELAQIRARIAEDIAASDQGQINRGDVTTVEPGDRFRLEVYVQDIRTDDGVPDSNEFGTYASYVDVEFDAQAFVPSGTYNNEPSKPILDIPVSYQNPWFLWPLGGGIDAKIYRFPNGPKGSLDPILPGVVNDVGSFLEGDTPIGTYDFFHFDIPFVVQSLVARNDTAQVAESSSVQIPVLANDELISGTKTFSLRPPSTHLGAADGTEYLLFGNTGYGGTGGIDPGSVVPENLLQFVADTVDVVNTGTLRVESATQGQKGSVTLNADGTLTYRPHVLGPDQDSFTYVVGDGKGNTQTATVQVQINAVRHFVVNSTGDAGDANIGDGISSTGQMIGGVPESTLRSAIQEANATANLAAGPDLILFDISGAGPHTIQPASALPTITQAVSINATFEPNYAGTPVVELVGSSAGAGVTGLRITAGGSTVAGLAINRFNGNGLDLVTGGGNAVWGNLIGTDLGGTLDRGNAGHGIFVNYGSNTIGGPIASERNVISGNDRQGVYFAGAAAQNNRVLGNRIGTNAAGTAALANGTLGVWVAAANNRIGGPWPGEGNLISGNLQGGVYVVNATSTGNLIQGNQIGTDTTGLAAVPNRGAGVIISGAPNNTVGGVGLAGNLVSGNLRQGVYVLSSTATGNAIVGNRIGTNATGTAALANADHGVYLTAPGNRVGGTAAGEGNVISGNTLAGVAVFFSAAVGNVIQGNLVGTDVTGTLTVPNATYGVDLRLSPSSTVGGAASGAGNVISGNSIAGVLIAGSTATGNQLQGNLIGTNRAGNADLGNVGAGVLISEASNNTVGGANAGNVISGNNKQGVYILGSVGQNNVVRGNLIGTDATGMAALPNENYGVWLASKNNRIGGSGAGEGNVISGNRWGGVYVIGLAATGNLIEGNSIGVDRVGTGAVPNVGAGILLTAGASSNTVGGTGDAGNTIAWNTKQGVYVIGSTSIRNAIRGNEIFRNGEYGIDLAPWGVAANDANDADTGPNNLQNYPVITTARLSGGTLTINYSVSSSTGNSAYPLTVEFFRADANNQEGETFLGSASYAAPGAAVAAVPAGGTVAGQRVLATATDNNGNTSEFSASVAVAAALLAPSELAGGTGGMLLRADDVLPVAWDAISVWQAAGLDAVHVAALGGLQIEVADLPGQQLGLGMPGRLVLDVDAAGYGWYVDATPGAQEDGVPGDRMDLLTVVLHEMGHAIGLVHAEVEDDLMADILQPGTRRLPTAADVDEILASGVWSH